MKFSFFAGLAAVAGIIFFAVQPATVSAEASSVHFAQQPQINTLVTIAIPPYKW
ncbi:MAG: hypothetical protein REI95_09510 [Oxalicibacterium faecigallinarum]|uniref:hypothetical protein n=1 Tax=Oxalicibacterium faecigallinarum TaxID=573741 RepID=UPI00166426BD|nr:hypothetical protein [Oxalicibacterium faecigallinarum]MDQ7969867.1 hypothetical protein [Oxalicibacterium faecigallinarum]